jgi:hypothetical protein
MLEPPVAAEPAAAFEFVADSVEAAPVTDLRTGAEGEAGRLGDAGLPPPLNDRLTAAEGEAGRLGEAGRAPRREAEGEAGLVGVVGLGDALPGSQSMPSAPVGSSCAALRVSEARGGGMLFTRIQINSRGETTRTN